LAQGIARRPQFIFKAAAQASKASQFILGFSRTNEEVPELQEAEA